MGITRLNPEYQPKGNYLQFNTSAQQNVDLNSYTAPGLYAVYHQYATNKPSDMRAFAVMYVSKYGTGTDRVFQVLLSLDDNNSAMKVHVRHSYHVYNATPAYAWSDWVKLHG